MNPKLIIADECISALDVSIQAQVVNLMKDIQQETGTAYLFIAHDLSMVKYISDRIGVLHLGHLLETGTTEEIFADPIHPYTRSLLSAIPLPNPVVEKRRVAETYDYATSGIDYSKGTSHLSAAATTSSVPMKSLQSGANKTVQLLRGSFFVLRLPYYSSAAKCFVAGRCILGVNLVSYKNAARKVRADEYRLWDTALSASGFGGEL